MKTQKLAFVISAALFAAAAPRLAYAGDPTTAEGWYTEGSNQYDLQNWDKAIDAFKKGAELEPDATKKSAYLYNIGQAYGQRKQAGDCTKAIFFYKRYLDLRDQPGSKPLSPEKRKAAEDKIGELEQCAKDDNGKSGPVKKDPVVTPVVKKDPVVTPPAGKGNGNTTPVKDPKVAEPNGGGGGEGEGEGDGGIHKTFNPDAPKLVSARLLGGVSKVSTGQITNPVHAGVALIGGYPLAINEKLSLELGAAVNYTPLLFQVAGMSKTGSVTGLMANAGAMYELIPKLAARVDLGVGALVMAGVSDSPYTMGQPTTGALAMFTVRAGVSVDYAITPNILATVMPFAFEFSPAKSGLRDDIKNVTRFDFMLGVGYRM